MSAITKNRTERLRRIANLGHLYRGPEHFEHFEHPEHLEHLDHPEFARLKGAMSRRTVVITAAVVLLLASAGFAQFRGRGGRQGFNGRPLRVANLDDFDGGFQFCRLVFRNGPNGDGFGWDVDFPRAHENLSIRLSELTRIPVSMDENREPKTLLLYAKQPEITHCPFIMMTEPGGAYFDDEEVVGLRQYLQRGGF